MSCSLSVALLMCFCRLLSLFIVSLSSFKAYNYLYHPLTAICRLLPPFCLLFTVPVSPIEPLPSPFTASSSPLKPSMRFRIPLGAGFSEKYHVSPLSILWHCFYVVFKAPEWLQDCMLSKSPAVWACLGVDPLDMPRTPYRASKGKRPSITHHALLPPILASSSVHHSSHQLTTTFLSYYIVT